MEEIWKDISEFEGIYQVSNIGRIKSLDRTIDTFINKKHGKRNITGKVLSLNEDKDGYSVITLRKNNKCYGKKVHRLVASCFLPNDKNLEQVNHRDGNKKNNVYTNLEWCSNLYNQLHAINNGLRHFKKIAKVSLENNKILKIYNSLIEVINENSNFDASTIIKVCKGKRNYHSGFKWIYATNDMKVGDEVLLN